MYMQREIGDSEWVSEAELSFFPSPARGKSEGPGTGTSGEQKSPQGGDTRAALPAAARCVAGCHVIIVIFLQCLVCCRIMLLIGCGVS